jgi:hypothetical protein
MTERWGNELDGKNVVGSSRSKRSREKQISLNSMPPHLFKNTPASSLEQRLTACHFQQNSRKSTLIVTLHTKPTHRQQFGKVCDHIIDWVCWSEKQGTRSKVPNGPKGRAKGKNRGVFGDRVMFMGVLSWW